MRQRVKVTDMLQRIQAKWSTWREKSREHRIERALYESGQLGAPEGQEPKLPEGGGGSQGSPLGG
jgi:hypothetical protein